MKISALIDVKDFTGKIQESAATCRDLSFDLF